MKNKNLIIAVLLLILVGGGSFFGGMKYQQNKRSSAANQFFGGRNGQQMGAVNNRNGNGFRPVAGQILSMDNQSVTLKLADGSSKIVILSGNTVYNKTQTGSLTDLKVGDSISVFGSVNTDGSVTAQDIQIGTLFGGMRVGNPTPGQNR
jgi:hypothetical protein